MWPTNSDCESVDKLFQEAGHLYIVLVRPYNFMSAHITFQTSTRSLYVCVYLDLNLIYMQPWINCKAKQTQRG